MIAKQRQFGALAFAATTILVPSDRLALGQDRLPPELVTIQAALGPKQQNLIDDYVTHWTDTLENEADEQVVEARDQLTEPLGLGATDHFLNAYSRAVGGRLGDAVRADRLVSRLNAMIVASRIRKDENVISLIVKGLDDESPALRYWAAKAVRKVAQAPDIAPKPAIQMKLLEQLDMSLRKEQSTVVLEQVFLAMVGVTHGAAVEKVYGGLNHRVRVHVGKPELPYRAERAGMQGLFRRLAEMEAHGVAVGEPFRQIARAAVRYLNLLSKQADGAKLSPDLAKGYSEMAQLCWRVLDYVHQKLESPERAPARPNFFTDNWKDYHVKALRWREILTKNPFNLTDADLTNVGE